MRILKNIAISLLYCVILLSIMIFLLYKFNAPSYISQMLGVFVGASTVWCYMILDSKG